MTQKTPNYQKTLYACFIGYIVQAIVNNFAPLLFVTFHETYHISLAAITLLTTFNFAIQLLVDAFSAGFINKIGYRNSILLAHAFTIAGFVCMALLPQCLPSPFWGLLLSVILYAIGGGLLEVLVSPIVEALPTTNKEKAMSLLHSFYSWGSVGVVLLSTLFFTLVGIQHWKILMLLWIFVPAGNILLFWNAPLCSLLSEEETGYTLKQLCQKPIFWCLLLIMLCAGACEQSVGQWASTFAEQGLSLSKTVGDLAGPLLFAGMMGLSRLLYGKYGEKLLLDKAILYSTLLCIAAYLLIALAPIPFLSLLGCGICGFSVGILWPGTYSMAAASLRHGGTLLFALLALAGDLGCSAGPTLVGLLSDAFSDNLKWGILGAVIFPILLLAGLLLNKHFSETRKA